jgi:hypothetical protein
VKPSIYNEHEALTREAQEFEAEIAELLRPVFENAQERFLVRDIATMINDVTSELAAITVLRNAMAYRATITNCPDCFHRWIEHRQTLLAQPFSHRCEHTIEGEICGCNSVKPNA